MQVLSQVIQKFMDLDPDGCNQNIGSGQERIRASLANHQLTYQMKSLVNLAGTSPVAQKLVD